MVPIKVPEADGAVGGTKISACICCCTMLFPLKYLYIYDYDFMVNVVLQMHLNSFRDWRLLAES